MSDEIRSVSSTGAEKGVKPERFDLVPYPALKELAKLYGKGAGKYAAHNWRHGYEWSKSYSAMMRHANQFWDGEDLDEEMGLSHMAAVAFHAFALLTFIEEHPEFDDRFKKEGRGKESARGESWVLRATTGAESGSGSRRVRRRSILGLVRSGIEAWRHLPR